MEASSSVNWSSPHIYTHTHQLGLSGSQHRCEIIIWPMCWQVNGLDMQVVTHHEAVSALRNAGSCIKMKVLRSRALPPELCALAEDPVIRETGLVIGKQHDPGNSSSGGGGGGGGRGCDHLAHDSVPAVIILSGNSGTSERFRAAAWSL